MTRFIVEYTIHQEAYEDVNFMESLRKQADKEANEREFIKVEAGYNGEDFMRNNITVQFIYK